MPLLTIPGARCRHRRRAHRGQDVRPRGHLAPGQQGRGRYRQGGGRAHLQARAAGPLRQRRLRRGRRGTGHLLVAAGHDQGRASRHRAGARGALLLQEGHEREGARRRGRGRPRPAAAGARRLRPGLRRARADLALAHRGGRVRAARDPPPTKRRRAEPRAHHPRGGGRC
eukprot:scaffold89055_cov60-Phaeocystis_antarctica.AAC.3